MTYSRYGAIANGRTNAEHAFVGGIALVAHNIDMADMLSFVLEAANYLTPLVFDNPRIYCFETAAIATAYCDASSSSCHIT